MGGDDGPDSLTGVSRDQESRAFRGPLREVIERQRKANPRSWTSGVRRARLNNRDDRYAHGRCAQHAARHRAMPPAAEPLTMAAAHDYQVRPELFRRRHQMPVEPSQCRDDL